MPTLLRRVALPAAIFLVTLAVVTSWTIPGDAARFAPALASLGQNGGVALLWWVGAAGLGLWIDRRWLRTGSEAGCREGRWRGVAASLPMGAAALLSITHAFGSLGLLTAAGGVFVWLPIAVGLFFLVRILRDESADGEAHETRHSGAWSDAVAPAIVAALAALYAAAAASAPEWLWSSEFGGYDAVSYHLELPKEWITTGAAVGPVEGNVYSALPSFVEAAFMQVKLMRGSIVEGALACQYWAMCAGLAAAAAIAQLGARIAGEPARWISGLAFLSLPWALVTGTLAYNDIVPCLFLAGAWLLVERDAGSEAGDAARALRPLDLRQAAVLALLAAAAVGAKPTALLFMALPLLAIVVVRRGVRTLRLAPLVVAVALAVLSPWLVRNAIEYGNPLFPFAHAVFGNGPWTDEQFAIFAAGHGPASTLLERVPLLWSEWLAHGTGAPPAQGEPWFPQWGLLPIAGLLGLALELASDARRRSVATAALVAIAIALVGWLLATHLKSRFLLPTAVPLAVGVALLALRAARATQPVVAPVLLAAFVPLPFLVYWREPARVFPSQPDTPLAAPAAFIGGASFRTGEVAARDLAQATTNEERAAILSQAPTAYFINFALPKEARIVAVGHATPFYFARPVAWNTVWDRGALDRVADEAPGTPEAWGPRLAALGFTHVLINPTMLARWQASGWLNPQLAPERWIAAFVRANRAMPTADGSIIVEIVAAAGPAAPQAAPSSAETPARSEAPQRPTS